MSKKQETKQTEQKQETGKDVKEFSTSDLEVAFGRLMRNRTQLQNQINTLNQELQIIDNELNRRANEKKEE